jgi:hypothetical protein
MKVIRSAYGSESSHTVLASEAISKWKEWNTECGSPLFVNCGWNRMNGFGKIAQAEVATQVTMETSGLGNSVTLNSFQVVKMVSEVSLDLRI